MTARRGVAGLVAALSVLPLAGCIFAVDGGGKKGLEKRIERLERRVHRMEKERGLPASGPSASAPLFEGLDADAMNWYR